MLSLFLDAFLENHKLSFSVLLNGHQWSSNLGVWLQKSSTVIGSYHLSGQEHVILPQHYKTHTLSLPRAAQHTHQLFLAHTCDIHTIDLNTHIYQETLSLLKLISF